MTQEQTSAREETAPARRGPGRPRHADTEERAFRAVLELFGRKGWSGLSLDGVATHAGIGKSSIYLRWKDKRDLLLDAMRDLDKHHEKPDTAGLGIRDYLVTHACGRARFYAGEYGPAMVHLFSAALVNPVEFEEIRRENITRGILVQQSRVEQAVADGELPAGTDARQLLDALEGAIYIHVVVDSAGKPREKVDAGLDAYVEGLVDLLLRGAGVPG